MLLIISPAKKMVQADDFAWRDLPRFLPQAERILDAMRAMSREELQALWKCSDALAELNFERVAQMDVRRSLAPAVFSYEGIQYQNIAPQVMTSEQLEYLQEHLRILSGFYGVLRPFDGVAPYRLEMQAKLAMPCGVDTAASSLYDFWGAALFDALKSDLDAQEGERVIVNLASVEYAKAVGPFARAAATRGEGAFVTCLFGSVREGKFVQRATEAKAARGTFVRWCAENAIGRTEDFKRFDMGGYRFEPSLSDASKLVFVR